MKTKKSPKRRRRSCTQTLSCLWSGATACQRSSRRRPKLFFRFMATTLSSATRSPSTGNFLTWEIPGKSRWKQQTMTHFLMESRIFSNQTRRCLKKKYPSALPSVSVVLIYVNEALSVIKRAVRSVITNTPQRLLREIILVDDHSTYSEPSPTSGFLKSSSQTNV